MREAQLAAQIFAALIGSNHLTRLSIHPASDNETDSKPLKINDFFAFSNSLSEPADNERSKTEASVLGSWTI